MEQSNEQFFKFVKFYKETYWLTLSIQFVEFNELFDCNFERSFIFFM